MSGAAAGMYGCACACACAAMGVCFSSNARAGSVSYSCALLILVSEITICLGEDEQDLLEEIAAQTSGMNAKRSN